MERCDELGSLLSHLSLALPCSLISSPSNTLVCSLKPKRDKHGKRDVFLREESKGLPLRLEPKEREARGRKREERKRREGCAQAFRYSHNNIC
jgi:hypothetical protein